MSTNAQHALLAIMVAVMSKEDIIDKLEQSIIKYKEAILLNKSKEETDKLFLFIAIASSMIIMKLSGADDPVSYLKEIDKIETARNLFNPDKS